MVSTDIEDIKKVKGNASRCRFELPLVVSISNDKRNKDDYKCDWIPGEGIKKIQHPLVEEQILWHTRPKLGIISIRKRESIIEKREKFPKGQKA